MGDLRSDDEMLREELLDDCIASSLSLDSGNSIEDNDKINGHAIYDKSRKEYVSNGHYKINGKDFMSIWTFKKVFGVNHNNTNVNGAEGKNLIAQGIKFFVSKPDFGGFNTIYIYPVCKLIHYYKIS